MTLHLPPVLNAVTIPNASLRHRGAQAGVWLHADGQLRFAPVKAGAEGLGGTVQILEGLAAGDEVVVYSRVYNIRDGRTVEEAGEGRGL